MDTSIVKPGTSGLVLFWDFDGTLVYSDHLWSRAMCEAINEAADRPLVCLKDVRPHMRSGLPWHTPERPYPEGTMENWWPMLERRLQEIGRALALTREQAETVPSRLRSRILDPGRYHLYPDSVSVLEWSRQAGYRNILLSNNYPELPDTMDRLGLSPYFESMVVSAHMGYEKPHPILFERALALAGVDAVRCVMIGDNPEADIRGGRQAGMRTVLVHREEQDGNADVALPSLSLLPGVLAGWSGGQGNCRVASACGYEPQKSLEKGEPDPCE